jgi:hypothetical protein
VKLNFVQAVPPDVEATQSFSLLEVLQNKTKNHSCLDAKAPICIQVAKKVIAPAVTHLAKMQQKKFAVGQR